jgi:Zn-finger nucleic acid-binding protein
MVSKKVASERVLECHNCWVPMEKKEIDVFGPNIVIDVCPKCHGTWFDNNEFEKLLNDKKMSNYLTKHIGTKSRSPMICPRCSMTMDIEKADEIKVDVCLNCNGVWIDENEFDALKVKSKEGFKGDTAVKLEELQEEQRYKTRTSPFRKLFRK